jgi:Alginate export
MRITTSLIGKSSLVLSSLAIAISQAAYANDENIGKANIDFRLRYESVSQDNGLKDADALILRTRLNYQTPVYNGISAVVEFEDSRAVELDDYNDTNGNNPQYSVIADPETTEVDQGFLQYKTETFTAKLGRQLITVDNHRFVGHVGWRQDRQTFDAATLAYSPSKALTLTYAYINQRNRIFAEVKDIESKDHLLNVSYKTSVGKFTGYTYLLEVDNNSDNALDTFGVQYSGSTYLADSKLIYTVEVATQTAESGATEYDATYFLLEAGMAFSAATVKLGYESLGSDDGNYGFSTPLATLHKFNGWSDQFLGTPAQGLDDIYLSLSGKALGGKWGLVYHDFSANDSTSLIDDLGDEVDVVYSRSFAKHYSAGIKYAMYSAGDAAAAKVDTDKLWIWVGATF